MKKYTLSIIAILAAISVFGQVTDFDERRELRKNLTVKEWNTEGKRRWLDRVTVYDHNGFKIEEIEYAAYGQKWRMTIEHEQGESGRTKQEILYDHKNKPFRIRRYEYNAEGRKIKQYNYLPSGKLFSVKDFEYTVKK